MARAAAAVEDAADGVDPEARADLVGLAHSLEACLWTHWIAIKMVR